MTSKEIQLSFLPQYKIHAFEFLKNEKLKKKIMYNDEIIDIAINVDMNNTLYMEEVSKEVASLIINIIKNDILKECILRNYEDKSKEDKEKIYRYSLDLFEQKEPFIRDTILNRVSNYILNNNYLNIDGFVKFRMKEFIKYISIIVDIALEEYLMQKDQNEFISVLKYFIDIQEEKIDLLRVHIMDDNSFLLYDKDGNKIEDINNEEIIKLVIKENLNYEDFLISTLLTLCPKKIEILDSLNDNSSKGMIDTIKSIFGYKVSIILPN